MGLLDKASEFSVPKPHDPKTGRELSRPSGGAKKKSDAWLGPTDIGIFEKGSAESSFAVSGVDSEIGEGELHIPDVHALLWNSESIENDLQAPAEIFALLLREFAAKQAALLVLGYEGRYFVPYAIKGYDETTEHRLRIPYSLLAESLSLSVGHSLIREEDMDTFKRFFSNREYSLISELLLVPFRHGDAVEAVFLTTDCPLLSSSTLKTVDFVTLSRDLGEIIHHSRNTTLQRLTGAEVRSRSVLLSSVQESLELVTGDQNRLTFFLVSLKGFLDLLHGKAKLVETYRLREDVIRIVSSMMPDAVNVFSIDRHVLLIIMPGKFHVNTDLLVHQIKVGLQTLFKIPQGSIDLSEKSFVYPGEVTTSQEIIERIFSYSGTE